MAEQVQQVTIKDPTKVEEDKRLAEHSHRKREHMKSQRENETNLTYYGAGVDVVIWFSSLIGYYIYLLKNPKDKTKESPVYQPKVSSVN